MDIHRDQPNDGSYMYRYIYRYHKWILWAYKDSHRLWHLHQVSPEVSVDSAHEWYINVGSTQLNCSFNGGRRVFVLKSGTLPETNIAHENPIFPGKYHQNGGFSMAMLVYRSVFLGGKLVEI